MPQETIQVLDVVLRESPSWNYVTVYRSFLSTTFGHRGDIGEGLEFWRGYYQSLRPTQMGLSLNIDISATSFFKPVTVMKFVELLSIRDTSRPLLDRHRVKIKKPLHGVGIETSHQPDQIRRYKITGITPIPMSQLIFPVDDKGTRKTVVQYFWNKPCLQAGIDLRPVNLPMEVCKIVEGQRYSKKLNDRQVTNILRATCKRPQEREQSICDMVLHNKYAEDRFAQEFGINVSSDLVAGVLPPTLLKYHDSGREKTCAPSVGQWNMINKKMINGGTIDNWTCLNFSCMRSEEGQRFCMDLTHMCNATGMAVNPRPFVEVKSAAPNHIENALRYVHRRATQMIAQEGTGNQLQLLIVILPEVSGSYGKIKTDIGIVSQCCLPKHASRPNKSYLENKMIKWVTVDNWICLNLLCMSPEEVLRFCMDLTHMCNATVGEHGTDLEQAFVCNDIPFKSEAPKFIFDADAMHPPPGEDCISSVDAKIIRGTPNNGGVFSDDVLPQDNVVSCARTQHQIIEVDVHILDVRVPVLLPENSYIKEAVYKAMAQLKIWISDYYTSDRRRVLQKDDLIGNSRDVLVNSRLRGGDDEDEPSTSGPDWVKLDHFIDDLQREENPRWLERIDIPLDLRRGNQMEEWFVDLGADALFVLVLLLDLLERTNKNNECYNGCFELSQIYFLPTYGVLVMDDNVQPMKLSDKGFKNNLVAVVKKLLSVHYRYSKPDGTLHFPIYVQEFVDLIDGLDEVCNWPFSMAKRLLIYNHLVTWSSARRVNTPSLVVQYSKGLGQADKCKFNRAMRNAVPLGWSLDVCGQNAPPAMAEVYCHRISDGNTKRLKLYPQNLLGRTDFIRCLLHHAMDCQVSVHVVDAAVAMIWSRHLQDVQRVLTLYYRPQSQLRNKGKGPSTLTSEGGFRVDNITKKEDLEIFEIFGLAREPEN